MKSAASTAGMLSQETPRNLAENTIIKALDNGGT